MIKNLFFMVWCGVMACTQPDPERLYPIYEDGYWGFMDSAGGVMVTPAFREVREFENGLAWVLTTDSGWTLVNKRGTPVLEERFDSVHILPHHTAVRLIEDSDVSAFRTVHALAYDDGPTSSYRVFRGDRCGLVDDRGRLIIPPDFDEVGPWRDGRSWYRSDGLYGYLDSGGVVRIAAQFLAVTDFGSGRAWVKTPDGFGMIDRAGGWIMPPRKNRVNASMFLDHLSVVEEVERVPGPLWSPFERAEIHWSQIDTAGKRWPFSPDVITLADGWRMRTFSRDEIGPADGVRRTYLTNFWNARMNSQMPEVYRDFRKLSDRLVYVRHEYNPRKWGIMRVYADSIGTPAWNEFDNDVFPLTDGLVRVMKREWMFVTRDDGVSVPPMEIRHWGIMDSLGHWVAPATFDAEWVHPFENGRAVFKRREKFGIVDSALAELLKPDFDTLSRADRDRWAFSKDGRGGVMDADFRVLKDGSWKRLDPYVGNLARFFEDKRWGYIDRSGQIIWSTAIREP